MKKITRSKGPYGEIVEVPDNAMVIPSPDGRWWCWIERNNGNLKFIRETVLACAADQCDNCGGSVPDGHSGWCPFAGCSSPSNSGTSGAADTPTVEQSDSSAPEFDGCVECQLPWKWSEYSKRWWCVKCGGYKPVEQEERR